jgi:hypothetical protein
MDAAALDEWVSLIVTAQSPAAPPAARDGVVALQNQVRVGVGFLFFLCAVEQAQLRAGAPMRQRERVVCLSGAPPRALTHECLPPRRQVDGCPVAVRA